MTLFAFPAAGEGVERSMGTREVYEQKLRSGNLHHDPTINPGLGSPRCPRCLSLVDPSRSVWHLSFCSCLSFWEGFWCVHECLQGAGEWAITSVLHDMTAVVWISSPSCQFWCKCFLLLIVGLEFFFWVDKGSGYIWDRDSSTYPSTMLLVYLPEL